MLEPQYLLEDRKHWVYRRGQRAAALKAKEIKGEYDKAKEKFDRDKFEDFQAANDQFAKDLADLARKYGKEAVEAAPK